MARRGADTPTTHHQNRNTTNSPHLRRASERITCHLERRTPASNDCLRVNSLVDELFGLAQQLRRQDANRRRAVADFRVLRLANVDEHLGSRVVNVDRAENSRTVVGHLQLAAALRLQDFVHAARAERRFDEIANHNGTHKRRLWCKGPGERRAVWVARGARGTARHSRRRTQRCAQSTAQENVGDKTHSFSWSTQRTDARTGARSKSRQQRVSTRARLARPRHAYLRHYKHYRLAAVATIECIRAVQSSAPAAAARLKAHKARTTKRTQLTSRAWSPFSSEPI